MSAWPTLPRSLRGRKRANGFNMRARAPFRIPMLVRGAMLLLLLFLGTFLTEATAQQQSKPAIDLGEQGKPDLRVDFSHFTNVNGRTFFILNVTNSGSRSAAVRQKLNGEGVCSVHTASTMTTAVSPTNAGWTVIPAERSFQIPFDPGWSISIWSNGLTYCVYIPYRDAKDTDIATLAEGRSYKAFCDDIPRHGPPVRGTITGNTTNSGLTNMPTGKGGTTGNKLFNPPG
jgi:hypothetical protein